MICDASAPSRFPHWAALILLQVLILRISTESTGEHIKMCLKNVEQYRNSWLHSFPSVSNWSPVLPGIKGKALLSASSPQRISHEHRGFDLLGNSGLWTVMEPFFFFWKHCHLHVAIVRFRKKNRVWLIFEDRICPPVCLERKAN